MRVGHVVESEDTEAEAEEEECAKGDEDPEGELCVWLATCQRAVLGIGGWRTTGTICSWITAGRGINSRKRAR